MAKAKETAQLLLSWVGRTVYSLGFTDYGEVINEGVLYVDIRWGTGVFETTTERKDHIKWNAQFQRWELS